MAPLDDALEALSHSRRRQLLFALQESESGVDAVPEDVVDGEVTERVVVDYAHVHLPLLEQQGYVRWDPDRDEVSRGPRFDELEPLLEAVKEYEDG